jgi:hypothetical protein
MAVQDDVAALREALRALESAAGAVAAHHGHSVDARRLTGDVERVRQDLELLCGQEVVPQPPALQVISDDAYPQDFWMDAEDEGLGGGR